MQRVNFQFGEFMRQKNDPLFEQGVSLFISKSKTCLTRPLKKKTNIGFQDRFSLNADRKYCRMLQESILQNFRPSLNYLLSLRLLFCLFLSGRLRQVLLYMYTVFSAVMMIHLVLWYLILVLLFVRDALIPDRRG